MAALAAAFAIDALTFVFSAWTLRQVKAAAPGSGRSAGHVARHGGGPGHGVARPSAQLLCLLGVVAFFVMGPLQVALPVLASERLDGTGARFADGRARRRHLAGMLASAWAAPGCAAISAPPCWPPTPSSPAC
jgi:hypothetical protein